MHYTLPEIPYLKLRCHLRAQDQAVLPEHKGSMLRGAFGNALKKTVCAMRSGQSCATCMLRQQCAHTRIFDTFIEGTPPQFLRGLQTSPRPFIFAAEDGQRNYASGDLLQFHFTLLGKVIELVPYVIFSFVQMTEHGLGRDRARFSLEQVDFLIEPDPAVPEPQWRLFYDGGRQSLVTNPTPLRVPHDQSFNSPCLVQFTTPTRLKFNNQFSLDFTFRMLVFKMLRRVLEIAHFYAPESAIDWNFHDLLVAADAVTIAQRDLRWQDWHRYSNRQKTEMEMGGFIGTMQLEGELVPFGHLLRLSEVVHVGKGTTFGLGKIRLAIIKN